jgi:hypothetical protein
MTTLIPSSRSPCLIPYIPFSQFAHLSPSIHVKTTSSDLKFLSVLLFHVSPIRSNSSFTLPVISPEVAAITTRGLCSALMTLLKESPSSSNVVGRLCLTIHSLSALRFEVPSASYLAVTDVGSWSLRAISPHAEPGDRKRSKSSVEDDE